MNKWNEKVAVVTGAASGIGAATAIELAKHRVTVIGLDINKAGVEDLATKFINLRDKIHAVYCNTMDSSSISSAFDFIEENFNGVDILITSWTFKC